MKLTGSLCNIEIILKEPVDCSECFIIESLGNIRTEDLFQKVFTQRNRKLIDQPSDSEFIIRKYSLL